ncbi:MAG: L-serine ammonia-lyase [Rhizobiales bacterium]|nr:L-serine ammonia-lyase [Hyphomicrobiales bacterium]
MSFNAYAASGVQRSSRKASRPTNPVGLTELFKIGIGPSSSHTVGPMLAAGNFARTLHGLESRVARLTVILYGSLAWTGTGHGTDRAIILGLTGSRPDSIDPNDVEPRLASIQKESRLTLPGGQTVEFIKDRDIVSDRVQTFKRHPNAMRFEAFDATGHPLAAEIWFSIGGGFVIRDGEESAVRNWSAPHRYGTAAELLELCRNSSFTIAELVLANERANHPGSDPLAHVDSIADAMFDCIKRGLSCDGELPGGLKVRRRARQIHQNLLAEEQSDKELSPHRILDFVSVFAMAVNEENAVGGRVVTAPTNGAAGVIPSVLRYYRDFCPGADQQGIRTFLLTATAIGGIIKQNASISGAEVGCQGEVGSASAMAAAGLAAALGATIELIENAAEIAMEHHLGMTCDPVGGLVQIPCIERNAFGAIKAINAASLAMRGDGVHHVSLDQVIETMRQTGRDMKSKYRETSRGGLAINVPNC